MSNESLVSRIINYVQSAASNFAKSGDPRTILAKDNKNYSSNARKSKFHDAIMVTVSEPQAEQALQGIYKTLEDLEVLSLTAHMYPETSYDSSFLETPLAENSPSIMQEVYMNELNRQLKVVAPYVQDHWDNKLQDVVNDAELKVKRYNNI